MTISFNKVLNFQNLSNKEAEKILYEELLPECEKKGVYLMPEGNRPDRKEEYEKLKNKREIFHIDGIQHGLNAVDFLYRPSSENNHVDKIAFEDHPKGGYLSGGELMAAMMLRGYPAKFQVERPLAECLRAAFPVERIGKNRLRSRLFVGEGHFKGVTALLNKHLNQHPKLGEAIVATELNTFGRNSDGSCSKCEQKRAEFDREDSLLTNVADHFSQDVTNKKDLFCDELCERIQWLKNQGVTVILGYDGTQIHNHPLTKNRTFRRIHWNCPHDKSNYQNQTLPKIIQEFFSSSRLCQYPGDRVHITLAQPQIEWDKGPFYQGVVYNIYQAAISNRYELYAKRKFGAERYPGYEHEQTGSDQSARGASKLNEFVFRKEREVPEAKPYEEAAIQPIQVKEAFYKVVNEKRAHFVVDTDDGSSSYSGSDA